MASGQLTPTQAAGALKTLFPPRKVLQVGYKNNVFLGLIPKDTNFYGDSIKIPLKFGGNAGGSAAFANALANKGGGKYTAFYITRVKDYALGSLETETVKASMSDIGAFIRLTKSEVDDTIRNASHMLNIGLYRNSGRAIGRISGTSTTTLTLLDPSDIVHFEVGMTVDYASTDGTSGSVGGHPTVITGVDRDAGTLTAGSNWNSGFNNSGYYLFRDGDFGAGMNGLSAWLPTTAPTSTLFNSVDRSVDVTRLGGVRVPASVAASIEEALIYADARLEREGGRPSHVLMNTEDHRALRLSLGSRVVYDKVAAANEASIGYRTIVLTGSQGDVQVVSDRDCPKGLAYMLQMDTWKLHTLGPAPMFLSAMGEDETLWEIDADAVQFRIGYYGNVSCESPGYNAVITLPS